MTQLYAPVIWTRAELLASGLSDRRIRRAVQEGDLLRLRRNHYARQEIDRDTAEAVRIGGRLSCLSVLRAAQVFVRHCAGVHVHLERDRSRIRRPHDPTTTLHWVDSVGNDFPRHAVALADAVRQSIGCQMPRDALATLDSVLNARLMTRAQVIALFDGLPRRFHALIPLLDASAESGPETYMRLILRALGVAYETQVSIHGVGRLDFVVDGWLIIECDSKAFHEGWDKQRDDRRRDLEAAKRGYVTIRFLAADIMARPDYVRELIADILAALAPRFARR